MHRQPLDKVEIAPVTYMSEYYQGLLRLFMQVWKRDYNSADKYISRFALYFPDFRGFVAIIGGKVVGLGLGTRSQIGQWWHNKVGEQVGFDHPALQDAWVLAELAVADGYRSRGIGSRLHDTLLNAQPCPRVLLSTQVSNLHARAFYERRGWLYLHNGFCFEQGDIPYLVMHKELRIYLHDRNEPVQELR